jgi:hypothetical protein
MSMKRGIVLCVGAVALLLLGLIGSTIGAANQAQNGKGVGKGAAGLAQADDAEDFTGIQNGPAKLIHRSVGFALNGSDYHVLTLHIIGVRQLHPAEMRALISSEKSIGEIRAELLATGTRQLKGYLRLGTHLYRLDNLTRESETNRTFTADLVYPAWDTELGEVSMRVGNLTVTVMEYEGARVADGELRMYDGAYSGEYRVLLTVQPPLPIRLGREK